MDGKVNGRLYKRTNGGTNEGIKEVMNRAMEERAYSIVNNSNGRVLAKGRC